MADRLLLVKLADIGDLISATPAIEAAVSSWPDAEITVLTSPHSAGLLQNLPGVRVMTFAKADFDRPSAMLRPGGLMRLGGLALRLRGAAFDRVAILHHLTTAAGVAKYRALAAASGARIVAGLENGHGDFLTHRVPDYGFAAHSESEYALKVIEALGGRRGRRPRPRVWLDPAGVESGARVAAGLAAGGYIAVHPGTGPAAPARRWPAAHFARLIQELGSLTRLPVVLVGGDADREAADEVQALLPDRIPDAVAGRSLAQTGGLLSTAEIFVGSDSGLLHLAAALGVRSIGLFGPTDPDAWAPVGITTGRRSGYPRTDGAILRSGVACSPCLYQRGRPPLRIACGQPFCMHAITVEAVVEAVLSAFQAKGRAAAGAPAQPVRVSR